ncbi:uncharacterized protein [Prorops nasuta]|uniref:uncharacterized protein n=1 Tax=Prorops nasuta TaxID=863751 RepID=UPI0034CD8F19
MRCCCYPNCKRDKNQIRSLFKVPKNSERRNEWRLAMGYTSLCNNNYVCELHFKEDDILRSYKTLMPDGSYNIIEKARPRLSPTSVPIKIVGNISTKKIGGKTSDISETSSVISTTNDVSIMDSQNNESESIPLLELFPSEDMNVPPLIALSPSFKCLDLRNLQRQICDQLPTEWTSFIICNQLTILNMSEKSENIKSLIIHEDTTTELYIANKKMVNISGLVNVESLSDILKNIKEISPLLLCQGIGDSKGYSTSCATYITLTSRNRRCKQCAIDKHKILLREKLNGHKLTLLKQKLMDKTRALKVANQRIKRLISKVK